MWIREIDSFEWGLLILEEKRREVWLKEKKKNNTLLKIHRRAMVFTEKAPLAEVDDPLRDANPDSTVRFWGENDPPPGRESP